MSATFKGKTQLDTSGMRRGLAQMRRDIRAFARENFNLNGMESQLKKLEKGMSRFDVKGMNLAGVRAQIAKIKEDLKTIADPKLGTVQYYKAVENMRAAMTRLSKTGIALPVPFEKLTAKNLKNFKECQNILESFRTSAANMGKLSPGLKEFSRAFTDLPAYNKKRIPELQKKDFTDFFKKNVDLGGIEKNIDKFKQGMFRLGVTDINLTNAKTGINKIRGELEKLATPNLKPEQIKKSIAAIRKEMELLSRVNIGKKWMTG